MTTQQAFALALQHHQAGRLAEAEALYRQILAVQPNHPEAWHHLGVIAHQVGRHELAIDFMRRAAVLKPGHHAVHFNLGEVYRTLGRFDEATDSYRRALELKPDSADAANHLGIMLAGRGRHEEAISAYRHALRIKPEFPQAHFHLGNALRNEGQFDEAIAAYRRSVEIEPGFVRAYGNLGGVLQERGRLEEAVAALRQALVLNPDYADAHNNLGIALAALGQSDEAVAAYRRALQLQPDLAETHYNLGIALGQQGKPGEAIAAFRRALELKPNYPNAANHLGNAWRALGQFEDAIAAYRRALELEPDSVDAHHNLAIALAECGRVDEAVAAYRRALRLRPDYVQARNNLGITLLNRGELEEAIAAFRQAIQLQPDFVGAHSNLLMTMIYHPEFDRPALREECGRWNERHARPWRTGIQPHSNAPDPGRRLRIGYVSPDFRDTVVGRNLTPLLRTHDRTQFEIVCYAEVPGPDHFTEEFRRRADDWRSTAGVGDEALAEMIRRDGVDILVDLALHTAGNRLLVFARQPAPVQVSFAAYPESTGVEAIGWRMSDRYLEPEGHSPSSERVSLLESFWCYDPCDAALEVNALPALKSGRVTFGNLNNFCKVNEPLLRLWALILEGVKDARLLLLSPLGSHRQRARQILERAGVEEGRVEFVTPCPRREYLELYHQVDVALDPFPYNGHTTSLDALWMGVPVVSLAGERPVSRGGLSQLSNLGLQELAAFSEEEYVATAVQLAKDLPRLSELRAALRARMEASLLMDAPRFTRNIETAYRTMWRQWCAAQQP